MVDPDKIEVTQMWPKHEKEHQRAAAAELPEKVLTPGAGVYFQSDKLCPCIHLIGHRRACTPCWSMYAYHWTC